MKLSEKFKQWLDTKPRDQIKEVQLEVIADDYAIEFAKFIETHCVKTEYLHQYFFRKKEHHITSLLEIFKKEKGL